MPRKANNSELESILFLEKALIRRDLSTAQTYLRKRFSESDKTILHSLERIAEQVFSRLKKESSYDDLTGLYNRRRWKQELAQTVKISARYRQPFSLLLIDLDDFKTVNERTGYMAGDRFLKNAVKVLGNILRESDLVGRWGGDEFCILLPQTDRNGAAAVADRLCASSRKAKFSISIGGISRRPSGPFSFPTAWKKMEKNLRLIKKSGGNGFKVS